jgi:hypothetical protein
LDHLFRGQVVIEGLIRTGLSDFPILTELAVEITTSCGYGKRTAGRQHMIKWFLLNGVYMNCTRIAIDQGVILPADVFPNLAISSLALLHFTGVWTEFATNSAIYQLGEEW